MAGFCNRRVLVSALFALLCFAVDARSIYQCKAPDGGMTMQDRPCAASSAQSEVDVIDTYKSTSRISAKRSSKAKAAFQRSNPCPVNGATRGRCPNHDIDHIEPLCAGGPDVPGNMQWITLEAHREKTQLDLHRCRTAAAARKAG
jgi:hypothetical protein